MTKRFGDYVPVDPPRIPVKVSINRNQNTSDPRPIRIEVTTEDFRTLAVIRLSLDEFAAALTGLASCDGEGWVPDFQGHS